MMKVDWQLRYRSPLAPSKGVDDVIIQTNSEDPNRAREVADHWLSTERAHPATRFIYLRPNVVMSEDKMRSALAPAVQDDPPAKRSNADRPVTSQVVPTAAAQAPAHDDNDGMAPLKDDAAPVATAASRGGVSGRQRVGQ